MCNKFIYNRDIAGAVCQGAPIVVTTRIGARQLNCQINMFLNYADRFHTRLHDTYLITPRDSSEKPRSLTDYIFLFHSYFTETNIIYDPF